MIHISENEVKVCLFDSLTILVGEFMIYFRSKFLSKSFKVLNAGVCRKL